MKDIQKYRFATQLLCLILTILGFFTNFKVAMLVIMALTLFSGVFFCGWICPYGFMQDLFSKLGQLLGIKKRKMPKSIQKILVFSRYIIFALIMLISADIIFSIMSIDPRANLGNLLSGNSVTLASIAVICFFALIALFFERPFCNYLCYEGAKYGLMSSFRFFTIKRDKTTCVNCKKCDKCCPMNIEVSKCSNLRSPQCINCLQCVSNCPVKGALNYGKINMEKSEKKRYFTLLTAALVLISVFIVYNILNGTNLLNNKHNANSPKGTTVTETLPSTSEKSPVIIEDNSEKPSVIIEDTSENLGEDTKNSEENNENLGDAAQISDGVYTGEGKGYRGMMTVQVTVKNQQITEVKVVEHGDDRKWFNRANNAIPDRIVENQSTDIDLVNGATYSSIGIRDGVKDALEKAK